MFIHCSPFPKGAEVCISLCCAMSLHVRVESACMRTREYVCYNNKIECAHVRANACVFALDLGMPALLAARGVHHQQNGDEGGDDAENRNADDDDGHPRHAEVESPRHKEHGALATVSDGGHDKGHRGPEAAHGRRQLE